MAVVDENIEQEEAAVADAEVFWDPPCENCVRSVASGKGTSFRCSDSSGRSKRCAPCKRGNHKCLPLRPELLPLARRCMRAFEEDDQAMKKRCRSALALMIELLDKQDPCFGTVAVAAASAPADGDREKAMEAWKTVGDYFFRR